MRQVRTCGRCLGDGQVYAASGWLGVCFSCDGFGYFEDRDGDPLVLVHSLPPQTGPVVPDILTEESA